MILKLKHTALAWKTAMVNSFQYTGFVIGNISWLGATLFYSCGVTIQNYMEYQCTETGNQQLQLAPVNQFLLDYNVCFKKKRT